MALETKRQNAGNKVPVALPNSGPPPPSPTASLETALGSSIGARVRVTTSPPSSSTYEGLLYTADPITNLIVLSIPPAASSSSSSTSALPPSNTFTILPIPLLTSFTILSLLQSTNDSIQSPTTPVQPPTTHDPNLPQPFALDLPSLNTRTNTTISAVKLADSKRGRGVTREAQEIFDGISRTYPARWMGTAMLVNENVLIESPYLVEDCRLLEKGDGKGAAPGSVEQGSLLRIKKVLAMEREKLALRRGLGTGGLGGAMGKSRGGGARAGLGLGIGERKGG